MSNLPLVLLAAPVITLMIKSGIDVIRQPDWPNLNEGQPPVSSKGATPGPGADASSVPADYRTRVLVISMAVSQVLLAVLALASYHVQVITRLASGYPVWCWWVASYLLSRDRARKVLGERVVVFGVLYALIQAALFACFLPPA